MTGMISLGIANDQRAGSVPKTENTGDVLTVDSEGQAAWAAAGTVTPPAGTDGDDVCWRGGILIPGRSAIKLVYDRTGNTPADTALSAALTAASASGRGGWVHLGDGYPNLAQTHAIPDGVTLTGSPQSMREGVAVWSPQKGGTCGTTILGTHAAFGKMFTLGFNSQVLDLNVHYPLQAAAFDPRTGITQPDSGSPLAYDYTFFIDGKFGCAINNVNVTNGYQHVWINNCQGAYVDTMRGWPLYRGIVTGPGFVYDVLRINNVHYNPNSLASTKTLLKAFSQANGVAFQLDRCDDFKISNCFALGMNKGIYLHSPSNSQSYGDVVTTGFDGCSTAVYAENAFSHGVRFFGGSWATTPGQYGLVCADSVVPASPWNRPCYELHGVSMGGGGVGHRMVTCNASSYAVVNIFGGLAIEYDQFALATDGAHAIINYTALRYSNGGGGVLTNGGTGISGTAIAL